MSSVRSNRIASDGVDVNSKGCSIEANNPSGVPLNVYVPVVNSNLITWSGKRLSNRYFRLPSTNSTLTSISLLVSKKCVYFVVVVVVVVFVIVSVSVVVDNVVVVVLVVVVLVVVVLVVVVVVVTVIVVVDNVVVVVVDVESVKMGIVTSHVFCKWIAV